MSELDIDGGGTIAADEFFERMRKIGRERRRAEKRRLAEFAAAPKPTHSTMSSALLQAHRRQTKRASFAWEAVGGSTRLWSTSSRQDLSIASLVSGGERTEECRGVGAAAVDDTLGFGEMELTPAEERLWLGLRGGPQSGAPIGPLRVVFAKTRRYIGLGLVLAKAGAAAYFVKPVGGGCDPFWTTDARLEPLPDLEPMSEAAWDNWFNAERLEAAGELPAAGEAYRAAVHAGGRGLWAAGHYRAARCFEAAGMTAEAAVHWRLLTKSGQAASEWRRSSISAELHEPQIDVSNSSVPMPTARLGVECDKVQAGIAALNATLAGSKEERKSAPPRVARLVTMQPRAQEPRGRQPAGRSGTVHLACERPPKACAPAFGSAEPTYRENFDHVPWAAVEELGVDGLAVGPRLGRFGIVGGHEKPRRWAVSVPHHQRGKKSREKLGGGAEGGAVSHATSWAARQRAAAGVSQHSEFLRRSWPGTGGGGSH
eukprot:SAG11_NODE_3130_length_2665_cov_1.344505_1_plen_485_part_00